MGRIRTIKPEFPQSESVGKVSREARLLFLQLFTIADDSGRSRAASRLLASLLYPYDDDAPKLMDGWLGELASQDMIRLYSIGGTTYLEIVKWPEHQKIDRPTLSRLPAFVESSRVLVDGSTTDLGPGTMDKDLGSGSVSRDDEHRGGDGCGAMLPMVGSATAAPISPKRKRKTSDQESDDFKLWYSVYPRRVDPEDAWKAYDRVVRSGKATPEELLAGAHRYAIEKRHSEAKYIKQPATWLNKGSWKNEPEVRSAGQPLAPSGAAAGILSYFEEREAR